MTTDELKAQLSGPHLLYVSGEDVDYERIEQLLASRDHHSVGTHCWLLRALPDRDLLADAIRAAMPASPKQSELLLAPVSPHHILYATQQGFGLYAWLSKANA